MSDKNLPDGDIYSAFARYMTWMGRLHICKKAWKQVTEMFH